MTGPTVDGAFVAARRPDVRVVTVDDGAVLVDEVRGAIVPLNASATLVWQCFDGASSLQEICTDLAEGLGVPFETILGDTVAVAADLSARGFLLGPSPADADAGEVGAPAGSRGPDASFPAGRSFGLTATFGDRQIRVRGDDRELLDLLGGALDGPVLVGDADPAADLSLVRGPGAGAVAPVLYLYLGDRLVFRTTAPGRLLRAALAEIEALLPASPGIARLRGRALVGAHGAVLVSGAFLEMLDLAGRRLARQGWRVLDGPAPVDRETLRLSVDSSPSATRPSGLASIDARFPRSRDELKAIPADQRVRALVVVGVVPESEKLASTSQRVAALATFVDHPGRPCTADDLSVVSRLGAAAEVQWVLGVDDQELLEVLARLARSGIPRGTRRG